MFIVIHYMCLVLVLHFYPVIFRLNTWSVVAMNALLFGKYLTRACLAHVHRLEAEGERPEAEAGPQPARALHAAPGGRAGGQVLSDALPEQRRRRRAVRRTQPHRDTGKLVGTCRTRLGGQSVSLM